MANNIYVGGFPYKTSKEDLAKLFSSCGTVLSAKVILDRETGRPKGFGFIEMSTDAEAKVAVEKLNGAFIGDRKIFVVEGRPDRDRPQGYTPKPSFAAKPAAAAAPGFVERRSGKDRRVAGSVPPAAPERRDAPAPASVRPEFKKPWVKKPFDASKKPWVKKPFDAAKKPFDGPKKAWEKPPYDPAAKVNHKPWVKKPFDASKKPWEKKPFDASKKPWEKKPFDPTKKPYEKKPFDAAKKPWAKKPFDRKAPVRGAKWTPKKD
jgi:RNA recognition motif-containing protein